ncbi:histidine-rich protein PFHRP-II-like [Malaya genurostris]|uniref:histidine-rich protein PFHRP-II-like n=1 Tax=Malaya genurostris TaxID=325434 RepID=UPI0026F3968B|nr:histidine-rich protein PFHRP-II-like [Malaya genurostris]
MKVFIVGSVLLLASAASASYWNYVPADTPEVAHAKAQHLAAHQAARGLHGAGPIDTPEVQHAKAQHFAAHAAARAGHSIPHPAPAWHAAPAVHAHAWHGAGAWHGPQHIPVIHNGVPVETPEVQHAKAAHLAALHAAGAGSHWSPAGHEDDGSYKPHWDAHNYYDCIMRAFVLGSVLLLVTACSGSYLGHAVSSQYQSHDGIGGYSYGYADPNSQKHESKDAHGVTHGGYSYVDGDGHVQSVKYTADPIHGFQVVGTNLPKGPAPVGGHEIASYGHYASPWAYQHVALDHDGSPIETPEVQAAKAAHFAAHAEARARLHKRSIYAAPWNHVPVDTPEVSAAKSAHFAAHAAAKSGYGPVAPVAHWDHHELAQKPWHGPIHIPVIHKGVPVETPEVQHAKLAHAAAHAKLQGYDHQAIHEHQPAGDYEEQHHAPSYGAWHGPLHFPVIHNGVPVETPEVQHAKAAHLHALASASAHSGAHWDQGKEDDGSYDPKWEAESYA